MPRRNMETRLSAGSFCCKTKTTREECEEKLKVLIAEMKKEIAEIKANAKNEG